MFVVPVSTRLEITAPTTFSLIGNESMISTLLPHLQEFTKFVPISENYDQILFPNYSGDTYLFDIGAFQSILFYENGIELIMVIPPDLKHDATWMIHAIFKLKELNREVTMENILTLRYEYLSFASLRSEFDGEERYDLFATQPATSFVSKLRGDPEQNIGFALTLIDRSSPESIIRSIEGLFAYLSIHNEGNNGAIIQVVFELAQSLKDFQDKLGKELILIQLNLLAGIQDVYLSDIFVAYIIPYAKLIRQCAEEMNIYPATVMIDLISNWSLKGDFDLSEIDWGSGILPKQLKLLPALISTRNIDHVDYDELQKLVELNFKVLADPIPYLGMEAFQERLAELHFAIDDFNNSDQYYEYAAELYKTRGYEYNAKKASLSALYAEIEKYNELAIAANLFHYTGRSTESASMGWSALTSALNAFKELLELEVEDEYIVESILSHYPKAKRPLIADKENDMTQVIELKLDELFNFIKSYVDGGLDRESALQMTDMHLDSLRFLRPAKPPRFMLMTIDGRLIDSQEAVVDPEEVSDATMNHLVAGALTAIRSILQEATNSSGVVKEINAGDSILLMEATTDLVLVCAATNVTDDLRRMVAEMADYIQIHHGDALRDWFGDAASLEPVRQYIREQIVEQLL